MPETPSGAGSSAGSEGSDRAIKKTSSLKDKFKKMFSPRKSDKKAEEEEKVPEAPKAPAPAPEAEKPPPKKVETKVVEEAPPKESAPKRGKGPIVVTVIGSAVAVAVALIACKVAMK